MNSIVVVALLAVCAGAQLFDQTTDLNKILLKSRFNKDQMTVTDLLRSTGLLSNNFNTRVATPWVFPTTLNTVDNKVDTTIYTLDEIVRHPLFNKFLTLPLFRQHLSHPLFQYYLTTPLFQQYWTIPEFQTFFQNPYLFYKYVYPVVFNTHKTTSVFDKVNVDTMYPSVDTVLDQYKNINMMNTIYGKQVPMVNNMPYKMIMDKLFNKNMVTPQITEVVTDVKIMTNKVMDKNVVDNTLNYKIVDGKIIPVMTDRTMVLDDIVKRPVDITMIKSLLIREPTLIKDLLIREPVLIKNLLIREPVLIKTLITLEPALLQDLLVLEPVFFKNLLARNGINTDLVDETLPIEKLNKLNYKIVDGKIIPVMADRTMVLEDILKRPVDITMIKSLLIREPTLIKDLLIREPVLIKQLLIREPTLIKTLVTLEPTLLQDLLVLEPVFFKNLLARIGMTTDLVDVTSPIEKFNKINYKIVDGKIVPVIADRMTTTGLFDETLPIEKFETKNMNIKDAMIKRMIMNKMIYGDRKIDEVFPEYTTEMKNIPILEKISKINQLNRLEKINTVDKLEKMMNIPTTNTFEDLMMTRPVVSDLTLNKDLLTHIPLTKEMKDFTYETPMTMTTQGKIFGDNTMYTMPTEVKTIMDLEQPITNTKTVIV